MIIRSKHDKRNPYLTISMKILRDRRLTPEERDCLIMMLSNADGWEFSYTGLAAQLGVRRETIKTRIQGLIEKGYVSVSYPIGENGKPLPFAKGTWEIREEPIHSAGFSGTTKPAHTCVISRHENIGTNEQALENRHEDLGTINPAQRITEGVSLPKDYQFEDYQSMDSPLENPLLLEQASEEAEEVFSPTPNKDPSSESSSEANASPLQGKKPGQGEQVISQKEYMYQQFLKKYPKAPLNREKELTRQAFFNIPNLEQEFDQIMLGLDEWLISPEWRNENGRFIKKPLNWIEERQWEKANVSDTLAEAYMNNLFSTEED